MRESVLAYRFKTVVVREGAVAFDPGNLDDFHRAQRQIEAIRADLAEHGEVTGTVKVTTRAKTTLEPLEFAEIEPEHFADYITRTFPEGAPAPGESLTAADIADIPPSLDRRPKAT